MRELSLFTGAGGGLLGTHLLGWEPCGYVEWNKYCQQVIAARINDGFLRVAPIFTDVREFVQSGAAREYRGFADVVTAGFPCQPFSVAGKQQGADDERNMWPATRDVIRIVRPSHILLENVAGLLTTGYAATVASDLASMGYVGNSGCISAASLNAPHERDRWWAVSHANSNGKSALPINDEAPKLQANDSNPNGRKRSLGWNLAGAWWTGELAERYDPRRNENSSRAMGMDDGVANRLERLRAIGGGQVPAVVRTAWELLA